MLAQGLQQYIALHLATRILQQRAPRRGVRLCQVQVSGVDQLAFGHDRCPLHAIQQLTYVAGPVEPAHGLACTGIKPACAAGVALAEAAQEVLGQQQDIAATFA